MSQREIDRQVTGWLLFFVVLAVGLLGGFVINVGILLVIERLTP